MDKITKALQGKKGLVVYITAGFPDYVECEAAVLAAVEAGADVIELGMPFSDPLADGPVLQKAGNAALAAGANTAKTLALVKSLRQKTAVPMLIMTYITPLLAYGLERFTQEASEAGLDGLILPDVPEEEGDLVEELLRKNNLAQVRFLAPTSGEERIKSICQKADGAFIYCLARTGVTGVGGGLDEGSARLIELGRKYSKLPLAMGFGISSADDARQAVEHADAAIVGSAVVKKLEEGGAAAVGAFVKELRQGLDLVGGGSMK